jgi:hypothetical protein
MTTVLKFALSISDHVDVEMPRGAQLLSVGTMRAKPCVYALVDESNPPVTRRLRLTATSEPIPDHLPAWKFVGSVLVGSNDCHLWDLGELAL